MAVVNAIYKGISRKEAIASAKYVQQIKTVFNQCIQYRKEKTERKQQKNFNTLEITDITYQSIGNKVLYTLHLKVDIINPEKALRFQTTVNNWLKRYLPKHLLHVFEYETCGKVDQLLSILEKEPYRVDEIQRIVLIPRIQFDKKEQLFHQVQTNPDNLVFIRPLPLGSLALYGFTQDIMAIVKGCNDIDRLVVNDAS